MVVFELKCRLAYMSKMTWLVKVKVCRSPRAPEKHLVFAKISVCKPWIGKCLGAIITRTGLSIDTVYTNVLKTHLSITFFTLYSI